MDLDAGVICARGAPDWRNSPAHPRPGTPDLLQSTKTPLVRPTWPDSARMLISQLSQGRILPLGMPLAGRPLIGSSFDLRT
jgi:hypothetical protein